MTNRLFNREESIKQVLNKLEKELIKLSKSDPVEYEWSLQAYYQTKNRYKKDLEVISKIFRRGKILEVGSAPYHLTFLLKKLGLKIFALDVNSQYYKRFIRENNINVKICNIEKEKIPYKNESFDLVILNEVIEHLGMNPLLVFKEINRVLKKNGYFLLTTPNLYALHRIIMFLMGKSFNNAIDEFLILDKFGYMGHIRLYSSKEIKSLLKYTRFKLDSVKYETYDKFSNHKDLQKFFLRQAGYFVDLIMYLIPFFRSFQIFISKK